MIELTEQQVGRVEQGLSSAGVELHGLKLSLLDHICCAIEEKLGRGGTFDNAFDEVFASFGKDGLLRIQDETNYLLTQNETPMKQITFFFGIAAGALIIIGSLFKMQHWPGANISLVLGVALMLFGFVPCIFIEKIKAEFSKAGKAAHIFGWLGTSVATVGVLAKLMHWPGANVCIYGGVGLLILLYMPLLVYKNTLEKSTVHKNKYVMVFFVVGLSFFLLVSLRGPSRRYLDGYSVMNHSLENSLAEAKKQNEMLYSAIENSTDTSAKEKAMMVKQKTKSVYEFLENVKAKLAKAASAEQSGSKFDDIVQWDNMQTVQDILFANSNLGQKVEEELNSYTSEINKISGMEFSSLTVIPAGEQEEYFGKWHYYAFGKLPVAAVHNIIGQQQQQVLQVEENALLKLKH